MIYGYDKSKGYTIVGEGGAGSGNHGHGGRPGLRGGSSKKISKGRGGSFDGTKSKNTFDADVLKKTKDILPTMSVDYLSETLTKGNEFLKKIYNDDLSKDDEPHKLYKKYCTKEEVAIIEQTAKNWYNGGSTGINELRERVYDMGMSDIKLKFSKDVDGDKQYDVIFKTEAQKHNALAKMYIINQKYLYDCGVDDVIVYRGVGKNRKSDYSIGNAKSYEFASVESWTTDLQTGITFAMNKYEGAVLKGRFKRSEILFTHSTTPSAYTENEITICPEKTAFKFNNKNKYNMKYGADLLKDTKEAISFLGKKPDVGDAIDVMVGNKKLTGMIVVDNKGNLGSTLKLMYPGTNKFLYVDQDDIVSQLEPSWKGWD